MYLNKESNGQAPRPSSPMLILEAIYYVFANHVC
jgi:hypothetical protein